MKKLSSAMCIAAMLLAGCSSENDFVVNEEKSDVVNITRVGAETSEDLQKEMKALGTEGFRFIEFDGADKILRQSIWKQVGDLWTAGQDLPVNATANVAAVYPAGAEATGTERIFKAGENNMTAIAAIDMSTDGEFQPFFKHQMCQMELVFKDQNGKLIGYGNANGQVSAVTLNQPTEMTYSLKTDNVVKLGEMAYADFDVTKTNYIIPGGENYEFKITYKSATGEIKNFVSKPTTVFAKNNKYTVNFRIEENTPVVNMSLTGVNVEQWNYQEIESIVEVVPQNVVPEGAIKEGTLAPKGTYVAFAIDGVKYALDETKFAEHKELVPFGLLISNGKHQVVMAGKECPKSMWQWSISYSSWQNMELIPGVFTEDFYSSKADEDYGGKANTDAMIKWTTEGTGRTVEAATRCAEFEFNGQTEWYLPGGGELMLFMDNRFNINKVLANITGFEEIKIDASYWSSSQSKESYAYAWSQYSRDISSMGKNGTLNIRPVMAF